MQLTRNPLPIGPARRLLIAAACALLAVGTCTSALALRMEVTGNQHAANPKAPVHVKQDALKITSKTPPVYPAEAKTSGDTLNGTVVLDVVVGKDGSVENIKVAKSLRDDYDSAAMDAVRQWRFEPFLLNGNPIEVATTINITYSLRK